MTRPRPLPRRVATVAAGVLIGLLGAAAVAGPAGAEDTEVSGSCEWDPAASEWVVTWTVTSGAPDEVDAYQLDEVTVTPEGTTVDLQTAMPVDAHEPLVAEQRLPEDATSASLAVRTSWEGHADEAPQLGEVQIPAGCESPESPIELGQWTFDCDALTITVDNPTEDDVTLTFAPSAGDPVDNIVVGGGVPATIQFPAAEGLSVDILSGGRSIVDPDEPIEITSGRWAELACDDEGGEGGGLPATGSHITLIVAGAAVLLALGGGLYLIARRRRIIFTA